MLIHVDNGKNKHESARYHSCSFTRLHRYHIQQNLHPIRNITTNTGVNGSSNGGGGGEKRANCSDAGNMSLTGGGGPGSGIGSRTGGSSGNGTGSPTTTGGITGELLGDNSTAGSLCSSVPDAKRFLRLCTTAKIPQSNTPMNNTYFKNNPLQIHLSENLMLK